MIKYLVRCYIFVNTIILLETNYINRLVSICYKLQLPTSSVHIISVLVNK